MAQQTSVHYGARALGMGNGSTCLADEWSIANNVAGLAEVQRPAVAATYHAIPLFRHFNRTAVVVAIPIGLGVAGISISRFGDDLYSEQLISVGYANTFGLASLGFRVNYLQYRAEGLETRNALTVSFGGLARLTPQLLFGACVININQPTINDLTGEHVPTTLRTAMAYKPSANLIASVEIEKQIDQAPVIKAGFEYRVFEKVIMRSGFNLRPISGFAGAGFKPGRIQLDYGIQSNDLFGLSHQATVLWQIMASR